jgi:hypothetical protein
MNASTRPSFGTSLRPLVASFTVLLAACALLSQSVNAADCEGAADVSRTEIDHGWYRDKAPLTLPTNLEEEKNRWISRLCFIARDRLQNGG